MSLKEQLAGYRAGWYQRVPADRQAIMQRHIDELRASTIARTTLKVGDQAPPIVLKNAKGTTVDVGALIKKGPVVVTFYRGGWCPYCNLELKAYQEMLPEIAAAGASLVAISPEKPDDTLSTVENNALRFELLSDLAQKVGRAFGLVLRVHRRAQAGVPRLQSRYPGPQWNAGRMGATDIRNLRYRPQRLDHLRLHGCRLPRSRRSSRCPASPHQNGRRGVTARLATTQTGVSV